VLPERHVRVASAPAGGRHRRRIVFRRLHLANLGYAVRLGDLEALCRALGLAVDVEMPIDRHTGRSRGFAFLTFATADAARTGLAAIDGRDLGGQAIVAQMIGDERA
jgi:RNA recognition motif-containing protein